VRILGARGEASTADSSTGLGTAAANCRATPLEGDGVQINELLQRVGEQLTVGRAFGPAYEHDGTLVIPVATVFGGGGGGSDSKEETAEGGGVGGIVHPLGAYVVRDGRVRFVPTIDVTLLMAGALLLLRLLVRRPNRYSSGQRRQARPSGDHLHSQPA